MPPVFSFVVLFEVCGGPAPAFHLQDVVAYGVQDACFQAHIEVDALHGYTALGRRLRIVSVMPSESAYRTRDLMDQVTRLWLRNCASGASQ